MKIRRKIYRYLFVLSYLALFLVSVLLAMVHESEENLASSGANWSIRIAVFVLLLHIITAVLFWWWRQKSEIIGLSIIAQPTLFEPFVKGTWMLSSNAPALEAPSPVETNNCGSYLP